METETVKGDSKLFNISLDPEEKLEFSEILYNKGISILPNEGDQNRNSATKSSLKCWNCGELDHGLRECKQEYNGKKINKNRLKFQRYNRNVWEFKRYHLEIGEKYPDAVPGTISNKLRGALGLGKNQLPRFIYNMRTLGYPPGWLEECKQGNSGINMLDSNGDRVPNRDEEEGEIFVERQHFDFDKIIEFPGYNVWPPPDTINETQLYYAEQMRFDHSKEEFIRRLKEKMENAEESPNESLEISQEDNMDAEEVENVAIETSLHFEFIPPLPENEGPVPPPPPEESEDDEIEEGEAVSVKKISKKRKSVGNENGTSEKKSKESSLSENKTPERSKEETHGRVKMIEFGTPVLKLHSPFMKLPPPEAFSKDISDVEFFENLPNSTGKYEQLKVVLQSVRSKLNVLRDQKPS